jgi:predicted transcriptional regulator
MSNYTAVPETFEQKLISKQLYNITKELADMTAQRDKLLNELAVMEADRDYWQECYWCIT